MSAIRVVDKGWVEGENRVWIRRVPRSSSARRHTRPIKTKPTADAAALFYFSLSVGPSHSFQYITVQRHRLIEVTI
jgi:hypothetical protein